MTGASLTTTLGTASSLAPIPPSPPQSPSNLRLTLLVWASVASVVTAVCAATVGRDLFALGLALATSGGLWILLLTLGGERIAPVFRAIGRTPPSPAALRDVFRAPSVVWGTLLLGHALLSATLIVRDASAESLRAALLLLAAGGAQSIAFSWHVRLRLEGWLLCFAPSELAVDARLSTAPRVAAGLSAIFLIGTALIALLFVAAGPFEGAPRETILPVFFVPLCASLVGALFGFALSHRLDDGLHRLSLAIERSASEALLPVHGLPEPLPGLHSSLRERVRLILENASLEDSATRSIQELQKQKMMFMASTGHDLRSPLNSILGFSELLLSEPDQLTAGQIESLRAINRSGEELLQLLRDILEAARIATGHLTLDRAWIPAVEILAHAVEQAHKSTDRSELRIDSELQPGLPPVYVDRSRVLQALGALLRHASRRAEGGAVQLKAYVEAPRGTPVLRVSVVDRSEGLRPEDHERVFEAFREVSLPSGQRVGGLGLALSLARSLIVAHSGEVSAANTPGLGTTFTITLPIEKSSLSGPSSRPFPKIPRR